MKKGLCEWKFKKVRKSAITVSMHETKGEVNVSNKQGIVTSKPIIINQYNNTMNQSWNLPPPISFLKGGKIFQKLSHLGRDGTKIFARKGG